MMLDGDTATSLSITGDNAGWQSRKASKDGSLVADEVSVLCAYFIHGSGELQEAGLVETTQQKAPQVFDWPSEFDP